ncbi:MAG TPA: glucose-6-phosphate isomerase, partial [Spongiibacteraceae bacterium]|nr:glucose-6-phosphate isomerase [Spongiibacteraceae bacterium]
MNTSDTPRSTDALEQHRQTFDNMSLLQLFVDNPARAEQFTLRAGDLLLDFSKNFCTQKTLQLFAQLADQRNLRTEIDALFSGALVNVTECRPALHTALRASAATAPKHEEIQQVLQRMEQLVDALTQHRSVGFTGLPITDVIHIGIGGSDLGPRFVTAALQALHTPTLRVHFVANVDPNEIDDTLAALDPATTLVITASKSFATQETLANSRRARQWLAAAAGTRAIDNQLAAITANPAKAIAFGVGEQHIFPMWDWVGGRYSLWSAIGLPIAIAIGWQNFQELLRGAENMDEHYRNAPFQTNMPVLLAMLECWYSDRWQAYSALVLPYSHRLRLFPAFLQQLSMESLGKSVDRRGRAVAEQTGLVIWGEPGTNSQHSFMQLLHQGTRFIPVDFIGVINAEAINAENNGHLQHVQLFANCVSQSQALMTGKSLAAAIAELRNTGMSEADAQILAPHKVLPGNRPSNTILLDALGPRQLGALIALYEHKVHVQSIVWDIDAFDQWGVELGKQSADQIYAALTTDTPYLADASTNQLIRHF